MNITVGHLNNNITSTISFWSVIFLFFVLSAESFSQNPTGKNQIILFGQITNSSNGAPVNNQKVVVTTDTINEPNFVYTKKLITDIEGYFYDTISTSELKGFFIISTKDFENIRFDTTVYYRFNWSDNNVLEANLSIPIELGTTVFQANFKFQANPNGNQNLEYQFTDLTNSPAIIMWEWDFGDGMTSGEQNPLHTYADEGIYRVKLNATKYIPQSQSTYQSSMVKIVHATTKGYHIMGGHVKAGYFPIDHGMAYLYKVEQNNYLPIDTAQFNDTLGYYYFPQLIEGKYIVKADLAPNSNLFNQYLATYYVDKEYWEEADTIFHYSNNFEYDIQLIPNDQVMTGPGLINGTISYGYTPPGSKNLAADNVVILLLNEDDQVMDICHSDDDGNFVLDKINFNSYNLYAEVTGKHTVPVPIVIDENNSTLNSVNITIGNYNVSGSVNSGIQTNYMENLIGYIYPNPVVNQLFVEVNSDHHIFSYEILNAFGQSIQHGRIDYSVSSSIMNINTSALSTGVYFLKISDENNLQVNRKFFKH